MEAAATPAVMLNNPGLARLESRLRGEGWDVVLGWEMTETDRPKVRAVLHIDGAPLEQALLQTLPNLGLVAVIGAGYGSVDVGWCRAHGVEVTTAAGLNAADAADYAMGLVIAGWRGIPVSERMLREGRWEEAHRRRPPRSLSGRRLGIVGLGAIGVACARRAEPFGLEINWWGPRPKPDAPWPQAESLSALAAWSDILLVASRSHPGNRGVISREVIEAVGPDGMIVNIARGALIDEDALIAALKDGRLGRAALDVFVDEPTPEDRWADVPNTLLTPHDAGMTSDVVPRLLAAAIDNIRLFLAGQPLATPVRDA